MKVNEELINNEMELWKNFYNNYENLAVNILADVLAHYKPEDREELIKKVEATLEILDCIGKLELSVDIAEAQNYFFSKIVNNIDELIQNMTCSADRELVTMLFEIGENLNINMDYYKQQFNKALVRGNK